MYNCDNDPTFSYKPRSLINPKPSVHLGLGGCDPGHELDFHPLHPWVTRVPPAVVQHAVAQPDEQVGLEADGYPTVGRTGFYKREVAGCEW